MHFSKIVSLATVLVAAGITVAAPVQLTGLDIAKRHEEPEPNPPNTFGFQSRDVKRHEEPEPNPPKTFGFQSRAAHEEPEPNPPNTFGFQSRNAHEEPEPNPPNTFGHV